MSKIFNVMEADCETACHCCGRVHRKLFLVDGGYWLGRNCAEDYDNYKKFPKNHLAWRGYEKKYNQIEKMIKAKGK